MKKIYINVLIFIILCSLLTCFILVIKKNKTTLPLHLYKKLKLNLTKEELNYIDKIQHQQIPVAIYNSSISKFILNDINQTFGFNFKFQAYHSFSEAYHAVVTGKAKLMPNITYSTERAKELSFSQPINIDRCYLFSNNYQTIQHLNNAVIAIEKGTIWRDKIHDNMPQSKIIEVENIDEALEKFYAGTVNVILANDSWYQSLINHDLKAVYITNYLQLNTTAIAGTKNQTELLLSIISKYTNTSDFNQKLTNYTNKYYQDMNISYLNRKIKELNVDTSKTYKIILKSKAPFAYYKNNKYTGIFPDTLKDIAKLLGIKYKIIQHNVNDSVTDLLLNSDADMIMPVEIEKNNQLQLYLSDPLYTTNNIIVERSNDPINRYTNVSYLLHEKIGLVKGSSELNYFNNLFPKKNFYLYNSYALALKALEQKQVNYIPMGNIKFLQYINDTNDFSIQINKNIMPYSHNNFAIAFRKTDENKNLNTILSIALRIIDMNKIKYHINAINYEAHRKRKEIQHYLFIGFLIILSIITLLVIRFRKLTRTDFLCDVLNRHALYQDYKNGLSKNKTLLSFNINKLSDFNDMHGHNVGDSILKFFAHKCEYNGLFKVYRITGNEFIVIDSFPKEEVTLEAYINSLSILNVPSLDTHSSYRVTSSVGILSGHLNIDHLDTSYLGSDYFAINNIKQRHKTNINLLQKSLSVISMAVHETKNKPKNQIIIDEQKLEQYSQRLMFRRNLENAIKNQELFAYFQPVIDIKTNHVIGMETLSRWQLNGVFIRPDLFIAEAKVLGLESEIDRISCLWAEKCYYALIDNNLLEDQILKENGLLNNLVITLNLSEQSLKKIGTGNIDISNFIIPNTILKFEILEDIVIDNNSMPYIDKIFKAGYKIAIDDFGSGNTSLKHVKEPKFSTIKIDRSLVPVHIHSNEEHHAVTVFKYQIKMLQKLNKTIIVEGVETQEQIDFLKNLGVRNVQGFYYAKPMALPDLISFIKARR